MQRRRWNINLPWSSSARSTHLKKPQHDKSSKGFLDSRGKPLNLSNFFPSRSRKIVIDGHICVQYITTAAGIHFDFSPWMSARNFVRFVPISWLILHRIMYELKWIFFLFLLLFYLVNSYVPYSHRILTSKNFWHLNSVSDSDIPPTSEFRILIQKKQSTVQNLMSQS